MIAARKQLGPGLLVDVVDPHIVLGVVDVVGRGNHEAGAGDQL
jgi:hypothetical protein